MERASRSELGILPAAESQITVLAGAAASLSFQGTCWCKCLHCRQNHQFKNMKNHTRGPEFSWNYDLKMQQPGKPSLLPCRLKCALQRISNKEFTVPRGAGWRRLICNPPCCRRENVTRGEGTCTTDRVDRPGSASPVSPPQQSHSTRPPASSSLARRFRSDPRRPSTHCF